MNKVTLIGRITKDLELYANQSGKNYTRFALAVNRDFTKEDGSRDADFINCVAWENRAEILSKYLKKGNRVAIDGKLQVSKREKEDGSTIWSTDVIVQGFEFLESKPKENVKPEYSKPTRKAEPEVEESDPFADFGNEVQLSDEDLPF